MFRESAIFELRGPWGVPVQIAPSLFLLLFIFVALGRSTVDLYYLYYDALFFLILIASIFLHEMGHVWGSIVQRVPVRRVVIYGGGGWCETARRTSAREDELIVAMGPIVNLALWALASLASPHLPYEDLGWIAATIAYINLFLAVFNLLPVLPLDGGRLLHLVLLHFVPARTALRLTGAAGLACAILWIPLMVCAVLSMGVFLVFFPPVALHWKMLTRRAA